MAAPLVDNLVGMMVGVMAKNWVGMLDLKMAGL
jgi:hypothetical protein